MLTREVMTFEGRDHSQWRGTHHGREVEIHVRPEITNDGRITDRWCCWVRIDPRSRPSAFRRSDLPDEETATRLAFDALRREVATRADRAP